MGTTWTILWGCVFYQTLPFSVPKRKIKCSQSGAFFVGQFHRPAALDLVYRQLQFSFLFESKNGECQIKGDAGDAV